MAGRFRAAFDGGSRGNPGPAAWGVVVLDEAGRPLEGFAGFLGTATNNVAEYNGLLEALRLAAERQADEVELQADSELIVRQLEGRYRVKNAGLKPLFLEAQRRIRGFRSFRVRHVRREDNREADRLVNLALDRADPSSTAGPARWHETFAARSPEAP
jgi:ribonuclease HI